MLLAIESYYYPANDNLASEGLHSFIAVLCTCFVNRVHLERYNKKWKSKTPGPFFYLFTQMRSFPFAELLSGLGN